MNEICIFKINYVKIMCTVFTGFLFKFKRKQHHKKQTNKQKLEKEEKRSKIQSMSVYNFIIYVLRISSLLFCSSLLYFTFLNHLCKDIKKNNDRKKEENDKILDEKVL